MPEPTVAPLVEENTGARNALFCWPTIAVPLFLLLLSLAYCWPLLKKLNYSCRGDWDGLFALMESCSLAVFEYGQLPLWNPYSSGGMPMMGNPHSYFPSPLFIVTSLFGVVAGMKIAVWLYTFVGMWGMWTLAGYLGVRGVTKLVPAVIFMFTSSWALHLTEGHANWLLAAWLPLLFLAYLKGVKNSPWLVAAALLESVMFYEGGTYIFAYAMVFLAVYASADAVISRSMKPLQSFLVVNLLAVGLMAPKLFPVMELLGNNPRPMGAGKANSWDDILAYLLERPSGYNFSDLEIGSYVGFAVVILFLGGLTLWRTQRVLIIASLTMLFICMGNIGAYSPWNLLHYLPLFASFQLPTRAMIVFVFTMALLSGLFLEKVSSSADRRVWFVVGPLILYITMDLFTVGSPIFIAAGEPVTIDVFRDFKLVTVRGELSYIPPAQVTGLGRSVASVHRPFTQIRVPDLQRFAHGAWSDQYLHLLQNEGVVDAYEPVPVKRFARALSDTDYRGEFHLRGSGEAALVAWSPNRLVYHVRLRAEDRLIVNQNFWKGWRTSRGNVISHEGLLAVDLPSGEYDVVLRYLPLSFLYGIVLFAITMAGIAAYLWRNSPVQRLGDPERVLPEPWGDDRRRDDCCRNAGKP